MNRKIISVFAVIFTLFLIFASVLMFVECFSSYTKELLTPAIVFSLASLISILFLILDVFIGRKRYIVEKEQIIVGRKGKMLYSILKKEIISPEMIVNPFAKNKCFLSFYFDNKRHIVSIKNSNDVVLKGLLSGTGAKTDENIGRYLLTSLIEIFCV